MSEVIKVEVSKALAKKFRKRAMEVYGYKKGAIKVALESLLKRFVISGEVDWKALRGTLKSELSSVELQHRIWRKVD
ncbi:MAG: hypothetical protein QXL89_07900 [Nitrososphaeria archaeon]